MFVGDSSVQVLSRVWLFATPWTVARQASLSITKSWGLLKLMFIELVMPSKISSSVVSFLSCLQSCPASGFFLTSQFFISGDQNIGDSSSASVPPMNTQNWFRNAWFNLLAVQGTLRSLLWHHSSKASILWRSALFIVQLSHPYITTGKTHSFD